MLLIEFHFRFHSRSRSLRFFLFLLHLHHPQPFNLQIQQYASYPFLQQTKHHSYHFLTHQWTQPLTCSPLKGRLNYLFLFGNTKSPSITHYFLSCLELAHSMLFIGHSVFVCSIGYSLIGSSSGWRTEEGSKIWIVGGVWRGAFRFCLKWMVLEVLKCLS